MKQKLYYPLVFVTVPLALLFCELLDNTRLLMIPTYIPSGMLLLLSTAGGFFSPTRRRFDYFLALMMPCALFCTLFVAGFLDKSDLETRFHLYKAAKAAFQPIALQLYFLMAVTAFAASYRRIRALFSRA